MTTAFAVRRIPLKKQLWYCTRTLLVSPKRLLSGVTGEETIGSPVDPILDVHRLQNVLQRESPAIATSLGSQGYWMSSNSSTCTSGMLTDAEIRALREQSIRLRSSGRFEPSWSERVDATTGERIRFDKEGVFACEPEGSDYDTAPDILLYMSTLIRTLPLALNEQADLLPNANLSDQMFNAKLAVTSPGGSTYPLHVDNTLGMAGSGDNDDARKLTCILYLNPDYQPGDGGELRLLLLDRECVNVAPSTGMVIFWSDEIPHEVLACKPDATDPRFDRYALTIWLPDTDPYRNIQRSGSKFERLRTEVFRDGITWC